MKDAQDTWKQDVEKLVEQSVVAGAVARVVEMFEKAMDQLDPESRDLLSRYFEGVGVDTLSDEKGVSQEEIRLWIDRAKRELNQYLRTRCAVKQ